MCIKLLKRLSVFLVAFSLLLSPCFSERNYTITETQLENLKREIETQEKLASEQEKQIQSLNSQLQEQSQLLMKSRNSMIETTLIVGGVSFCLGAVIASAIIIGVQNVNLK